MLRIPLPFPNSDLLLSFRWAERSGSVGGKGVGSRFPNSTPDPFSCLRAAPPNEALQVTAARLAGSKTCSVTTAGRRT